MLCGWSLQNLTYHSITFVVRLCSLTQFWVYGSTDCARHSKICGSIYSKTCVPHIIIYKWWDFEGSRAFFGLWAFWVVFITFMHFVWMYALRYSIRLEKVTQLLKIKIQSVFLSVNFYILRNLLIPILLLNNSLLIARNN